MKKGLLLILSLVLALGLACPTFAATDGDISTEPIDYEGRLLENDLPESEGWIQPGDLMPNASSAATLVFKKTSSTTCKAQALASRAGATTITSKLYVQILNGSTYNTIAGCPTIKTVSDDHINHIATYSISSRKTYRLKVAISHNADGMTSTNYYYASLNSNGY